MSIRKVLQNAIYLSSQTTSFHFERNKFNKIIIFLLLTMAVISSKPCRNSTIFDLWDGSTLAKQQAFRTAFFCSYGARSSNSRPVKALLVTSSSSLKMPIRRQMATAVPLLSPVGEDRKEELIVDKSLIYFLYNECTIDKY